MGDTSGGQELRKDVVDMVGDMVLRHGRRWPAARMIGGPAGCGECICRWSREAGANILCPSVGGKEEAQSVGEITQENGIYSGKCTRNLM